MSATPIRRRSLGAVAAVALCLALLTGCTQTQRDATSYKGTKDHFLQGCEETAKADNKAGGGTEISSPKTWCACVFDAISDKKTGIEFDRFAKANAKLRDKGGKLPADIQKAYDSCDPSEG